MTKFLDKSGLSKVISWIQSNFIKTIDGKKPINGNLNLDYMSEDEEVIYRMKGNIGRSSHNSGYLIGGYKNIGDNSINTNPIYVIGEDDKPEESSLGSMYGVGFTKATAGFINETDLNKKIPGGGWGLYGSAAGKSTWFLESNNGHGIFRGWLSSSKGMFGFKSGEDYISTNASLVANGFSKFSLLNFHPYINGRTDFSKPSRELKVDDNSEFLLFNGGKVWNSGQQGSGSGMDADTVDGKHASDFINKNVYTFNPSRSTGWYRIASTSGVGKNGRANALITINGVNSGKHASATFIVQAHYGKTQITQISGNSFSSAPEFSSVRTTVQSSNVTYGKVCFEVNILAGVTTPISVVISDLGGSGMNKWVWENGPTLSTQKLSKQLNNVQSLGLQSTSEPYYRRDTDSSMIRKLYSAEGYRSSGMYGIYNSRKIGHVWSMGTSYKIPNDGSTFGNIYGIAYKHTNNPTGGTMAGGHQIVVCNNGTPGVALGMTGNIWARGKVTATDFVLSSDSRVKENIIEYSIKPIDIKYKEYNYIEGESTDKEKRLGVIAQDLEESGHSEFVVENSEGEKSVQYIQLLLAKVAELESRLEKLEVK